VGRILDSIANPSTRNTPRRSNGGAGPVLAWIELGIGDPSRHSDPGLLAQASPPAAEAASVSPDTDTDECGGSGFLDSRIS
jgi:hypothetical protein